MKVVSEHSLPFHAYSFSVLFSRQPYESPKEEHFNQIYFWTKDSGRGSGGTLPFIGVFWHPPNALLRLYFIFVTTQVDSSTSILQMNRLRIRSGRTLPELTQLGVSWSEFETRMSIVSTLLACLSQAWRWEGVPKIRKYQREVTLYKCLPLAHIVNENLNKGNMNLKWIEWIAAFRMHIQFKCILLATEFSLPWTFQLLTWLRYTLKCVSLIFKSSKNWCWFCRILCGFFLHIVPCGLFFLVGFLVFHFVLFVCFLHLNWEWRHLLVTQVHMFSTGERTCIKYCTMWNMKRSITYRHTWEGTKLWL